MLNQVVLVGRVIEILPNEILMSPEKDVVFPVRISNNIAEQANNILEVGGIIGIKGKLQSKDTRVIIEADKITFLSSRQGGETDDNA